MKKKHNSEGLRNQGVGMIIVLAIEYLLGMATTSFVQFPENKPEGQLWAFAWKQFPLAAHIIIGGLLLVGAIVFILRSVMERNKTWIIASSIATVGIFLAVFGGSKFIPTQQDSFSFIMAFSFLLSFLAYGWGLYITKDSSNTSLLKKISAHKVA